MPPIEIGPGGPHAPRAVRGGEAKTAQTPVASDTARAHANEHSAVVRSAALDPGQPPIDAERVSEIRKAIEQGRYPIVPARVADAMIAAGLLLRNAK